LEEAVLRWKIVSFNSMNDAETYYLEKMKKKLVFGMFFAFIEKGAQIGRLMFDWAIDLRPQEKDITVH
jgi:hypothetical protein